MLAVWALPLAYLGLLWARRRTLVPIDYLVFVAPLTVWFVVALILKLAIWELTDGHAVFGPYGRDKGLSNAIVEPTLVLALSGVYLPALWGITFNTRNMRTSRRLLVLSVTLACLVAVITPPLRD